MPRGGLCPGPQASTHDHPHFGVAPDGRIFSSDRGHLIASTAISDVRAEARTQRVDMGAAAEPGAAEPQTVNAGTAVRPRAAACA